MKLSHIRALVTGAAGGIGSTVAAELVRQGAGVLLTDLREEALRTTAERLRSETLRVDWLAADICSAADRARLARSAARLGINSIVNVAGVNPFGMLAEQNAAQIELAFRINTIAPILLTQELLPHLSALPDAHIINVGSMLGSIAMPGYATYSATKAAMHCFSEALRREVGDTNIQVHYIAPRATRTPLNSAEVCAMNERLGIRMDDPAVVADAVVRAIAHEKAEMFLGFPERLFRIVNALFPSIVDRAVRRQLTVIKKYASRRPDSATTVEDEPLQAVNS
jgi:short-subunit dehydrogenase